MTTYQVFITSRSGQRAPAPVLSCLSLTEAIRDAHAHGFVSFDVVRCAHGVQVELVHEE